MIWLLLACTPGSGDCFTQGADRLQDQPGTATFVSHDPAVVWPLILRSEAWRETARGYRHTQAWVRGDTGARLGAVVWRVVSGGVWVEGWQDGEAAFVTFEHPVRIFPEGCGTAAEAMVTETDGMTVRAEVVGVEDCPVAWGLDWNGCAHLRIDDGDPVRGPIFAGDWWLVQRYGAAWMRTTGYDAIWDLESFEPEPDTG